MPIPSVLSQLSDRDLLSAVSRAAADERYATVSLLRLLAELDERRLYLSEGCSSLFTYCTQVLHLSEHAAYHRIEAARAARRFPTALDLLSEGALTLTTVAMLRPHLTTENHANVLAAARHRSKREVEVQIAALAPRPDAKPLVRKLPAVAAGTAAAAPALLDARIEEGKPSPQVALAEPKPLITPRAPDRYLLRVTISAATRAKLSRAHDLLRHSMPHADHADILDRALTLLVNRLERQKFARTRRPRSGENPKPISRRHIPATVKREVWMRDGGRCAFTGPQGRCRETGRLEFHHVVPFAEGGPATTSNIALRCRAHNLFESDEQFGPKRRLSLLESRSGPS